MKRLLYIIILITLPMYSQNKWEMTRNVNSVPKKLECPDSNNCFVTVQFGENWTNYQAIYKSEDQGNSWYLLSKFENNLYSSDMSCHDSSSIFLSYNYTDTILKSTNSGQDFELINLNLRSRIGIEYVSMYNKDVGVLTNTFILITKDGWESFKEFRLDTSYGKIMSYRNPVMVNDSILYVTVGKGGVNILQLNINSLEYSLYKVDVNSFYSGNLCKVTEKLFFICGWSNDIAGGSCRDAIYKSTDGGKNWRRVLDLYNDRKFNDTLRNPFGLQQIAFKDSLTGIAVGQFGTIIYTYDGGESWIYESVNPPGIRTPATMMVRYAGTVPIIATFFGHLFRMVEDNLAPGLEDIYTISGRVWEGDKGQPNIPVFLGYRVTMTDTDGYYKFTRLKKGSYTVKAMNKYHDNPLSKFYYKPFEYSPLQYDIELTHDTSGFDFNATDLRTYHTISGYVVDTDGKGMADIDVRFARSVLTPDGLGLADTITKTDATGKFEFLNIESYKTWDITPVHDNFKFSPLKHTVRLISNDSTDLKFTGTPTTSVWESSEDRGIVVSPNPASDFITISIPEINHRVNPMVDKVQIFDMLGLEVISTPSASQPPTGEGNLKIDVSHLPAGVYFIRIGNIVEKFVKI
ncbi:MAG: T9SS type A sorting domain-containing protein [Ignavibacteriae bacterium]|nr:T9SS type A sorting domain-containing protein [Ignavibacteriota bacterium]